MIWCELPADWRYRALELPLSQRVQPAQRGRLCGQRDRHQGTQTQASMESTKKSMLSSNAFLNCKGLKTWQAPAGVLPTEY